MLSTFQNRLAIFIEQKTVAKFTTQTESFGFRKVSVEADPTLALLKQGFALLSEDANLLTKLQERAKMQISLVVASAPELAIPIKVEYRGRHRPGLPMLGIHFNVGDTAHHCHAIFQDIEDTDYSTDAAFRNTSANEIFSAECFFYQLLEELSSAALRSCCVDVRFGSSVRRCLLVEDFEQGAKNRGGMMHANGVPNFELSDLLNFFLFQFIVGNSDFNFGYSDTGQLRVHNTVLWVLNGSTVPVPYDFQYVWSVAPHYWRYKSPQNSNFAQRNARQLLDMTSMLSEGCLDHCKDAIQSATTITRNCALPDTLRSIHLRYLEQLKEIIQ